MEKVYKYERFALAFMAILFLSVMLISAVFLPINQDEGWYLQAGKMVFDGKLPYKDFMYTQTPLLPYIYGWTVGISSGNLLFARLISVIFCTISLVVSFFASKSLFGRDASIISALIFMGSFQVIGNFLIVKTYSFGSLLLVFSVFFLAKYRSSNNFVYIAVSLLCMAFAAMVRLSLALPYVIFSFYLLYDRALRWKILSVVLLGLILILLPIVFWGDKAQFGLFYVHSGGYGNDGLSVVQWLWRIVYRKIQFFGSLSAGYTISYLVLFTSLICILMARGVYASLNSDAKLLLFLCLGSFIADIIPAAPQSGYQSITFPFLVMCAGYFVTVLFIGKANVFKDFVFVLLVVGFAVSLFSNVPLILKTTDGKPALLKLNDVSAKIRAANIDNRPILTMDTILAVNSNLPVYSGTEMSVFSFYGDMSLESAERYHVVNMKMLTDYANNPDNRVVIMSDDAWRRIEGKWVGVVRVGEPNWSDDEFKKTLNEKYTPKILDSNYGEFGDKLVMWVRKS